MGHSFWQRKPVVLGLTLLVGIAAGRIFFPASPKDAAPPAQSVHGHDAAASQTVWTCSMHPNIRQPDPGKCPICLMDLIPLKQDDAAGGGARVLTMTPEAAKLAQIETSPVERRFVDMDVTLVGKIDFDETRVKTIAAWAAGRLDRLYVDYTGVAVRKGDHLVELYSPMLYAAQEELLQAIRARDRLKDSESTAVQLSTKRSVESAREKLRLLGLPLEQIEELVKTQSPRPTLVIPSPASGIVIRKNATAGDYVETGAPLYTVADLSMVWVRLEAYESDIARLRYGQEVEIRTEAYGDKTFTGWVSFIDPVLDNATRTVKVRVNVNNPEGNLRPNMFVRARIKVRIGEGDTVVSQNLSGKWISPMHPEIVKDAPGSCDVCGMALVKAEALGYADTSGTRPALVIPASSVLSTGKRSVVYVQTENADKPTFEGVEIRVGARAGDWYVVESGLQEGQRVVTQGSFKIDSALQLLARPSMMNPGTNDPVAAAPADSKNGHAASTGHDPAAPPAAAALLPVAPEILAPLWEAYLEAQKALAADNLPEAQAALERLSNAASAATRDSEKESAGLDWRKIWKEYTRELSAPLEHRQHAASLEEIRSLFIPVSATMIRIGTRFGTPGKETLHVAFCPMAANNKGAEWVQTSTEVRNPYFGAAMLACGEIRRPLPVMPKAAGDAPMENAK